VGSAYSGKNREKGEQTYSIQKDTSQFFRRSGVSVQDKKKGVFGKRAGHVARRVSAGGKGGKGP